MLKTMQNHSNFFQWFFIQRVCHVEQNAKTHRYFIRNPLFSKISAFKNVRF